MLDSELQHLISEFFSAPRTARFFIDGIDSGTTMVFEVDGTLLLRNLLPELPPFIRLNSDFAEYSYDEQRWESLEDPGVNIYWLFDPRRLMEGRIVVEESEPGSTGDRSAEITYEVSSLGVQFSPEDIGTLLQPVRSAQIDFSSTGELSRVLQKGLEPDPEQIELRFVAQDQAMGTVWLTQEI